MGYGALAVNIADDLSQYLKTELAVRDLCVESVPTIQKATHILSQKAFHLLMVDLDYLRKAGQVGWLGRVRRISYLPVIVLSPDPEHDANGVVEFGADLCISSQQPFSVIADLAYAQFRRYVAYNHYKNPSGAETDPFQVGNIHIDPARRTVEVQGKPVELRPREFSLLLYFMCNPDIVLTNEQICENAWGIEDIYRHSVSGSVYILRQAIEADPKNPSYIKTVYRIGYRFSVKT